LADNKIAGGLEALAAAQLEALTTLDLSNNRISQLATLEPLVRSCCYGQADAAVETAADNTDRSAWHG